MTTDLKTLRDAVIVNPVQVNDAKLRLYLADGRRVTVRAVIAADGTLETAVLVVEVEDGAHKGGKQI